jgi:protein-tyrosine-phosphatase
MSPTPRLLFVCVENACRSQMAEAFAKRLGAGRVVAHSAGSRPADSVNPRAVAFMAERGYALNAHAPKPLSAFGGHAFEVIVTMGCGDACPWLPAVRRVDWELPDPKKLSDDEFRAVRDEIERRVRWLLSELHAATPGTAS